MVGIHAEQMRIIVVKSSNHFRADFQPIASHVLVAKAAGPMAADPGDLPWRKLPHRRARGLEPLTQNGPDHCTPAAASASRDATRPDRRDAPGAGVQVR